MVQSKLRFLDFNEISVAVEHYRVKSKAARRWFHVVVNFRIGDLKLGLMDLI